MISIHNQHITVKNLIALPQNALINEDRNFELLTYSPPNQFSSYPIQQKTILTKRCPLFIIERLKKDGIVDRLKKENHPIRLQSMEDVKFYQRIVVSLKYNGTIYGYLWIYEADDSFDEHVFTYLDRKSTRLNSS